MVRSKSVICTFSLQSFLNIIRNITHIFQTVNIFTFSLCVRMILFL